MSTDPWQALAGSLTALHDSFATKQNAERGFADGSPAHEECREETLAGAWGDSPAHDANLTVMMSAYAVMDHLNALATLLGGPPSVYAPFTVARSAMDIAAQAWFLLEPGIGARERVRRHINTRLHSLKEQSLLTGADTSPHADRIREHSREKTDRILESARQHGFTVVGKKNDKVRPLSLGQPMPKTTHLVQQCADASGKLGGVFWRHGSAVAHGLHHGLLSAFVPAADGQPASENGVTYGALSLSPKDAALQAAGAPLTAIMMLFRLYEQYGWDTEDLSRTVRELLKTWSAVAELGRRGQPVVPDTFRRQPSES